MTAQEMDSMLDKWETSQRFYWTGEETNQIYLINRQERTVIEIKNPEVVKFLYNNMYMRTAPKTFIDDLVNVLGFAKKEY